MGAKWVGENRDILMCHVDPVPFRCFKNAGKGPELLYSYFLKLFSRLCFSDYSTHLRRDHMARNFNRITEGNVSDMLANSTCES